jgi:hypothetical protein
LENNILRLLIIINPKPGYEIQSLETILDHILPSNIVAIYNINGEQVDFESVNNLPIITNKATTYNEIIKNNSDFTHIMILDGSFILKDVNETCYNDFSSFCEYNLDYNLWASKGETICGVEFHNFSLKRSYNKATFCSCCSDHNAIISKETILDIGGFDVRLEGSPLVEYSLRYLLKGNVLVFNEGIVTIDKSDVSSAEDNCYIMSKLFRGYSKYYKQVTNVDPREVDCSNVDLANVTNYVKNNLDLRLYDHYGSAHGKSIAIIGVMGSIDKVKKYWFKDFDIIIGVDYIGYSISCNYCVTDRLDVITKLINIREYSMSQMVVPYLLEDKFSGKMIKNPIDNCTSFSRFENYDLLYPPFASDYVEVMAYHFACFLKPSSITLFGYDSEVKGKSHTCEVPFYNNGDVWEKSDSITRLLQHRDYQLSRLIDLADKEGIVTLKVGYA